MLTQLSEPLKFSVYTQAYKTHGHSDWMTVSGIQVFMSASLNLHLYYTLMPDLHKYKYGLATPIIQWTL